ncbi:tyrosine recombinase [Actinomyces sp. B33]|uniref:tyrosine recombinase n=1 Tax=Actinomyces sp. B33 TaxID=2942131 RepID=UPI002341F48F|nr:tyrosine recombinase [Actinomyces sp. B33]MDC4233290.1 tyrosine recombinase [Actinomyces sp. B33]
MNEIEEAAADWLDQLRVERGASPHTVSNYRRDIDRYIADLESHGITALAGVSPVDVERHLADLSAGRLTGRPAAASSVARASASIRGLHRFAVVEGLTADDPAASVRPPRQGDHLPKALGVDEVARLLDAARAGEGPAGLRDWALLEVLYATGARVSEAVALCVDDVDLDDELPVVRLLGKGRKERLVPLGHVAKEALGAYLVRARPGLAARGRGGARIFLNARGAPLSRQSAWEAIQRCAERAGLDRRVSPHTLRHSFATHLLEGGASVRDVQELLGHASVQTTQIYTRVTATTLREIYRSSHPRARAGAATGADGLESGT